LLSPKCDEQFRVVFVILNELMASKRSRVQRQWREERHPKWHERRKVGG